MSLMFKLPADLKEFIYRLDNFIETEIVPLQERDDNQRFFDHRREHSRTDWDNQGLPRKEWEDLLWDSVQLADRAGFYRLSLPVEYGGSNDGSGGPGGSLWMAVIREHLASKGLGLFNDLQSEHSIVGNMPDIFMLREYGSADQRQLIPARLAGKVRITFGLTEPDHGTDATHMSTKAKPERRDGVDGFRIDGAKKWQTGMHRATHCFIFARTQGSAGEAQGISCFVVPRNIPGLDVRSYEWTLNMPTDHATITLTNVWVPASQVLGTLHDGLAVMNVFVHENRIRQSASSLGAADFCVRRSVEYASGRTTFGKPLSHNQAIQFPLVELATQVEMLRLLIRKTASEMDAIPHAKIERRLGDNISMCNYWANRLCCDAADRAIQVLGGNGYSRTYPFEHIWRHHRRYRITEGAEELQQRKVAAFLFGFGGRKAQDSKM